MRPRVLVIGPLPPPIHGAARVTERVRAALDDAGASVLTIDTSGGGRVERGLRYHHSRVVAHVRAGWCVVRFRRDLRSAYLAGAGGAGLWYQAFVLALIRMVGLDVTFHHHSYACLNEPRPAMRAAIMLAGPKAIHVVLCPEMGRTLREAYPKVREVRVCSNAGLMEAPPIALQAAGRETATLTLGHLGNLFVEKGLPTVINTLRVLRGRGHDVRLLLGGVVPSQESHDLLTAAAHEFGEAIEYVGPVPAEEVDGFYRQLDIFLFPSTYVHEAEPLVVLEASRCQVATVAFGVGCLPGLVTAPGRVVEPGSDFEAEVEALILDLQDPASRQHAARAVVGAFERRREAATRAHQALVRHLAGASA